MKKLVRKHLKVNCADIQRPLNYRECVRYVTKEETNAVVINIPVKYTSTIFRARLYYENGHDHVCWSDAIPSMVSASDRKVFESCVREEAEADDMGIITERTNITLPWQRMLSNIIQEDDGGCRAVYWVVDERGGAGKSLMSQWLLRNGGVLFADFDYRNNSYLYNKENVVVFDIPRGYHAENLRLVEDLKNGYLVSQKYEVRKKVFKSPTVVVFSNAFPDANLLSRDRWRVFEIVPGPLCLVRHDWYNLYIVE